MISEQNSLRILPGLGFECYDFVNPTNHSGGLAVLWHNTNVNASVLQKDSRAIHMLVHDLNSNQASVLSSIYAPAQPRDKDIFWQTLLGLNTAMHLPWCLIGDFNELADPTEKRGGRPSSNNQFARLNAFMNSIDASTIPSNGSSFTWKKRVHTHLIYERLDRAIARADWNSLYPNAFVVHGNFTCSDHCPILLTDNPPVQRRKNYPFRYQNYWSQYQQVQHIVKRQWNHPVQGTSMFKLVHQLKVIKQHIRNWARTSLCNNQNRLTVNSQKIQAVEDQLLNQPDNPRLNSWLSRLLIQREKLMLFNQKYWDRHKRNEWLVNGDRNSRYFHQLVTNRRKRNAVLKLQDDSGVWLDTQQLIADKLVTDFTARFRSSGGSFARLIDIPLETRITDCDNNSLLRIPNREEVKQALFSIDSTKTPGPDGFGAGFFKKYWDIIHQEFYDSITEFFIRGRLLR